MNEKEVKETSTKPVRIGTGLAGPGRPKGSLNKVTADIRAMVNEALHLVGGVEYLARQAEENPGPFMTLVGKVIPKELEVKPGEGNTFTLTIGRKNAR